MIDIMIDITIDRSHDRQTRSKSNPECNMLKMLQYIVNDNLTIYITDTNISG